MVEIFIGTARRILDFVSRFDYGFDTAAGFNVGSNVITAQSVPIKRPSRFDAWRAET